MTERQNAIIVPPAADFTRAESRRGMRHAILASCWGAIPQIVLRDSSIMILFATLIGAGEMISIATTALQDMAQALLILPFGYLTARTGKRRMIIRATLTGMAAFLFSMAAPGFGPAAGLALLLALSVFAVTIGACNSA